MELFDQFRNVILALLAALLLLAISVAMLCGTVLVQAARATGLRFAASPFELCFIKRKYWGRGAHQF